ncbi:MAG: hypothetical protein NTW03_04900, partial [Verrucomicrobia bacterium]|nr:hypothetical protein [Verrucomicrobiota bacterium]
ERAGVRVHGEGEERPVHGKGALARVYGVGISRGSPHEIEKLAKNSLNILPNAFPFLNLAVL